MVVSIWFTKSWGMGSQRITMQWWHNLQYPFIIVVFEIDQAATGVWLLVSRTLLLHVNKLTRTSDFKHPPWQVTRLQWHQAPCLQSSHSKTQTPNSQVFNAILLSYFGWVFWVKCFWSSDFGEVCLFIVFGVVFFFDESRKTETGASFLFLISVRLTRLEKRKTGSRFFFVFGP